MHALNRAEVYYHFWRKRDETAADQALVDIRLLGIRLRDDMDLSIVRKIGQIKAIHRRVSLADCCALALASRLGAALITADRHELGPLADIAAFRIEFIR